MIVARRHNWPGRYANLGNVHVRSLVSPRSPGPQERPGYWNTGCLFRHNARMRDAQHYLDLAAKLALRGHGGVEPNPMVGCVIVDTDGALVGWGYHRTLGGPHAERFALNRAGEKARGSTLYVTLEPCNHTGRTGPCSEAIIAAGVKRVVFACKDPFAGSKHGEARLREAGVEVLHVPEAAFAHRVTAPFAHRVTTGLPWIVAKWAQSIDGKLATRAVGDRWISSPRSRRMVHRERGRVDAILTGIGTVRADDPLLTVRHGRTRRIPRRIIIDPLLAIPEDAKLLATIKEAPLTIICSAEAAAAADAHAEVLRKRGVDLLRCPTRDGRIDLTDAMRRLMSQYDITNMLVEAGPGLLGRLLSENLVNMLWVFVAPMMIGDDDDALPSIRDLDIERMVQTGRLELLESRRRGADVMMLYGVKPASP
jgi:diaminohydroxyphosphoribosylaminopyrimidine deaminase/5-amino-6-(5-phosphoribosylamino)uracil reductase